jgi:Transglycosylase-like domain
MTARTPWWLALFIALAVAGPGSAERRPPEEAPKPVLAPQMAEVPAPEPDVSSQAKDPLDKVPTYKGDTAIEREKYLGKWLPVVRRCAERCDGLVGYRAVKMEQRMQASYRNARVIIAAYERAQKEQEAQEAWLEDQAPAPASTGPVPTGGVWYALAECESGGDWSYNGPSGFDGGLQFLPSTWDSMGTGYAYAWQAPASVQIAAAQRLQAQSGWGQWPTCAAKLGLL